MRSRYGVEIYQDPEVDIGNDLLFAAAQVNAYVLRQGRETRPKVP
jgi:hypothetical protein